MNRKQKKKKNTQTNQNTKTKNKQPNKRETGGLETSRQGNRYYLSLPCSKKNLLSPTKRKDALFFWRGGQAERKKRASYLLRWGRDHPQPCRPANRWRGRTCCAEITGLGYKRDPWVRFCLKREREGVGQKSGAKGLCTAMYLRGFRKGEFVHYKKRGKKGTEFRRVPGAGKEKQGYS